MMAIADNSHFSYQNEDDLADFIVSEMEKEGLDTNNGEFRQLSKHEVYVTTTHCTFRLLVRPYMS